jgi:transcriptional regulator with XRE-family HTH domain
MLDTAKIKTLREKLGLTMEQAAERAGFTSRQQWYNVESGIAGGEKGITLATLDAIAKALGCKGKDLLK